MSVLRLFVRSFHPLSNFGLGGLGFEGDKRGFSYSEHVTSRIYAIVQINLEAGTVRKERIESDTSSNLGGLLTQDYTDPKTKPHFTLFGGTMDPYRPDGNQGAQVALAYTGQNFAMPGAGSEAVRTHLWEGTVPALDVTASLQLDIDREEETVAISARMVGDGFPNAEMFLLQGTLALMLLTHRRIGSALHQLRGNRRIAMGSSAFEVDFPSDRFGSGLDAHYCLDYAEVTGGPIDVIIEAGTQPSSRSQWNKMHVNRDAEGGWGRYVLGDTLPTYAPGRRGSSMP